MKVLYSKKVLLSNKFLKELPPTVVQEVRTLAYDYKLWRSKVTFSQVAEGYSFHPGEGERITFVYGDRVARAEMVAQHNIGASGVCYDIGVELSPVPVGTWILTVYYYTKYYLDIKNIVPAQVTNGSV